MKTHNIIPGTPEWHRHRSAHKNASDAPAMLGCSPYKTREQLIREMVTGSVQEVDRGTQARFDNGHRYEALARSIGEEIMGDDLAPVVGSEGEISASYDGLNIMGKRPWEHKSLNDEIRAALPHQGRDSHQRNDGKLLGKVYRVQMEQQLLVCDDTECLFSATKWEGDQLVEERHAWYHTDPALRAEILAGWKLLDEDKAKYVPTEVVVSAVAAPQMNLPAVSIQVTGSIALVDNLEKFGTALTSYIANLNRKPETDQDFANLEDAVKRLKSAEEQLDAAESSALGQAESIDAMLRTVALHRETARSTRLLIDKLVKAEKENRRVKIVSDAVAALHTHMKGLQERTRSYMPQVPNQFQDVIKGLKSLDSMKAKVDSELARCKIEANAIADRICFNLELLDENTEFGFLFADVRQIVLKAADDFTALVTSRIAEHKAVKAREEEETRERIRAEEQAKAERQAREKLAAEQAATAAAAKLAKDQAEAASAVAVLSDKEEADRNANAFVDRLEQQTTKPITHEASVAVMPASVRQAMAPKPDSAPTLTLGEISKRLSGEAETGLNVTSAFLSTLGFEATTVKAAKLYQESDFPAIGLAIIKHIEKVCHLQAEPA